jgi:NADH-quinone oxidoreductase subunit J
MIDWELVLFLVFSAVEIAAAVLTVTSKKLVRAAFWLFITLVTISGIYILLRAEFVALIQILVYAGAVPILLLFGIMLTRKKMLEESETSEAK